MATLEELVDDLGYCFSQPEADHFMQLVRNQQRDEALQMLTKESYSDEEASMVYEHFLKEAIGDDSDLVELPRERWAELRNHKRNFIARVGRSFGELYASSSGDFYVGGRREVKFEQIGQVWEIVIREGAEHESN